MRRSVVPFAFVAWVLLMLQPCAARAAACCLEEVAFRAPAPFDEGRAEAGGAAAPPAAAPERAAPPAVAAPAPTPLDLSSKEVADKPSYRDVYRVLREDNECSSFFGGARLAVTVFNELARQLRPRRLGEGALGVVMTGQYTNYLDVSTGQAYRIFEKASLNSDGPFRAKGAQGTKARMHVGSFPAETRQARALMLLHELGHLIKGEGGKWLLPNDGGDNVLSERNTQEVESHCRGQLLALDN
jgi:hypothetical protein